METRLIPFSPRLTLAAIAWEILFTSFSSTPSTLLITLYNRCQIKLIKIAKKNAIVSERLERGTAPSYHRFEFKMFPKSKILNTEYDSL